MNPTDSRYTHYALLKRVLELGIRDGIDLDKTDPGRKAGNDYAAE